MGYEGEGFKRGCVEQEMGKCSDIKSSHAAKLKEKSLQGKM